MIDLKVGYSCNNNCTFCAVKNHEQKDRTFEEFNAIITRERVNNDTITLTGGEVTIRRDFLQMLDRASALGYNISIQSNGRMFSTELIRYMNNYQISNFLISIHGHSAEVHDSLTNVPNSFDQTVLGIENLINCGHNVTTNTVLTNSNINNIKDLCILLASLNVKNILLSYPDITGGALNNIEEVPKLSDIKLYIPSIVDTCNKLGMNVYFDNIPLCIMGKYYGYGSNKQPINLIMLNETIQNFIPNTIIGICKECKAINVCCHPQQKYIEKFGAEEFNCI